MFRLFLTVVLTSAATFAWFVFNPGNAPKNLLEKVALLDRLQTNYEVLPQPSAGLPDLEPSGGSLASVDQPGSQDRIAALNGKIETLRSDTEDLQKLADDLKAMRGSGENISTSDVLAINRQIEANKREVETLEKELSLLQ